MSFTDDFPSLKYTWIDAQGRICRDAVIANCIDKIILKEILSKILNKTSAEYTSICDELKL